MVDYRTSNQIKEHYKIEKELANKLRRADKEERRNLYNVVYNELYKRVPHIPHLKREQDAKMHSREVSAQLQFLKRFLEPKYTFMEIGAGDCSLSIEVAKYVNKVYAVDVSEEITKDSLLPDNCKLIISDGCHIPISENSINVAYSDQLMEHLHPDDAIEQLRNIYRALTHGGVYICVTPNRLYGPHDISKYFDEVATGLHLKEYTSTELVDIFFEWGFSKVKAFTVFKSIHCLQIPRVLVKSVETFLQILPRSQRKGLACSLPLRWLLRARVVGVK